MKIEVRNPGESHAEFAYRVLRSNILTLNMKPGMVINEKEIAAQLKISRTPVHEAVLKLKYEFLIDVRARKESKVSYIDVDLINEGFFLRRTLETAVLKAAFHQIGPDTRRKLLDNLKEQREIIEQNRLDEFLECDDRFHQLIYLAANKPLSFEVVHQMGSHLTRMRYLIRILRSYEFIPDSYREHEQIVHMLTFGIPAEFDVASFVANHIKGFQNYLPNIEKEYKEYFRY